MVKGTRAPEAVPSCPEPPGAPWGGAGVDLRHCDGGHFDHAVAPPAAEEEPRLLPTRLWPLPLAGSEESEEASSCSSSTYDCATYLCARCSTEVDMIHSRSVESSRSSEVCSAAARRTSRALSSSRRAHAAAPTSARRRREAAEAARREEGGAARARSARPRLPHARAREYWPCLGSASSCCPMARSCTLSCASVSEKRWSTDAMPPASSDALTVGLSEPWARSTASCSLPPASRFLPGISSRSSRSTNWCRAVSIVPTVMMRSCTFFANGEVNGSIGTRRWRLSHADTHSQQAASSVLMCAGCCPVRSLYMPALAVRRINEARGGNGATSSLIIFAVGPGDELRTCQDGARPFRPPPSLFPPLPLPSRTPRAQALPQIQLRRSAPHPEPPRIGVPSPSLRLSLSAVIVNLLAGC
eukprot:scaffold27070_cov63-Phaeocystis_antarctica.AAC.2